MAFNVPPSRLVLVHHQFRREGFTIGHDRDRYINNNICTSKKL